MLIYTTSKICKLVDTVDYAEHGYPMTYFHPIGHGGFHIADYFNVEYDDNGTFYMNYIYKCKVCGYTFESGNVCGTFTIDQFGDKFPNNERDAEKKAIEHIMLYHIKTAG